jgi:hypothetical protein
VGTEVGRGMGAFWDSIGNVIEENTIYIYIYKEYNTATPHSYQLTGHKERN